MRTPLPLPLFALPPPRCWRAAPACKRSKGKAQGGGGGDPSQVVAKVDDAVITVGDVQERINKQSPFVRARYTTPRRRRSSSTT